MSTSDAAAAVAAAPACRELTRDILHLSAAAASSLPMPYPLGAIDCIWFSHMYLPLLWFYRRPADWSPRDAQESQFMDDRRLRTSFERLMNEYPLLAARVELGPAGEPIVTALDKGVTYVTAESDCRLSDLPLSPAAWTGPACLPASLRLVEPSGVSVGAPLPLAAPLLAVQVTRFACGGVCLAVRSHHYLTDAESWFNLVRDWGQLYETQSDSLRVKPVMDRSWMSPTAAQIAAVSADQRSSGAWTVKSLGDRRPCFTVPGIIRVVHFTADELMRIKDAASVGSKHGWLSTLEALSAHLLRAITAARTHGPAPYPSSHVRLILPFNVRSVLDGPHRAHASSLFGNGLVPVMTRIPLSDLQLDAPHGLARVTDSIHECLEPNRISEAPARATLAWMCAQASRAPGIIRRNLDLSRDLIITGQHKFGVHAVAFAGVRPLRVCHPQATRAMAGVVTLLDTPMCDGSIDACFALQHDVMNALLDGCELHAYRQQTDA